LVWLPGKRIDKEDDATHWKMGQREEAKQKEAVRKAAEKLLERK
jgi:hypothetical protein